MMDNDVRIDELDQPHSLLVLNFARRVPEIPDGIYPFATYSDAVNWQCERLIELGYVLEDVENTCGYRLKNGYTVHSNFLDVLDEFWDTLDSDEYFHAYPTRVPSVLQHHCAESA